MLSAVFFFLFFYLHTELPVFSHFLTLSSAFYVGNLLHKKLSPEELVEFFEDVSIRVGGIVKIFCNLRAYFKNKTNNFFSAQGKVSLVEHGRVQKPCLPDVNVQQTSFKVTSYLKCQIMKRRQGINC